MVMAGLPPVAIGPGNLTVQMPLMTIRLNMQTVIEMDSETMRVEPMLTVSPTTQPNGGIPTEMAMGTTMVRVTGRQTTSQKMRLNGLITTVMDMGTIAVETNQIRVFSVPVRRCTIALVAPIRMVTDTRILIWIGLHTPKDLQMHSLEV